MLRIRDFIKKEIVFCIAFLAAAVSCFFVPPDESYLGYIDFKTLALLYCLMVVVSGFRRAGLFTYCAHRLCVTAKDKRMIGFVLVLLSFFCSMLITNDVSLLTFVPFSVVVFDYSHDDKNLVHVVVLQAVAANLGSMLTPVGNPQNIYISTHYGMGMKEFFSITAPVWLASLLIILLCCFIIPRSKIDVDFGEEPDLVKNKLPIYTALFLVCMLVVLRIISWPIMLAIVLVTLLFSERIALKDADFMLLATFVCFFIFSGNLARIDQIDLFLKNTLLNREYITSVLCSQVISNVPATLLLSNFTDNARSLLLGVDIGGLGTPIASLASLIAIKLYSHSDSSSTGKFLIEFSIINFALLILLSLLFGR